MEGESPIMVDADHPYAAPAAEFSRELRNKCLFFSKGIFTELQHTRSGENAFEGKINKTHRWKCDKDAAVYSRFINAGNCDTDLWLFASGKHRSKETGKCLFFLMQPLSNIIKVGLRICLWTIDTPIKVRLNFVP